MTDLTNTNKSTELECGRKRKFDDNEEDITNSLDSNSFCFSEHPTLEKIREMQAKFAEERNWNQFHTPRNLVLALVGEVGELAEIFQWKGEVKEGLPGWNEKEKEHLGQELSDVLLYLIRIADKCKIDLPISVTKKLCLNAQKYPASRVSGYSKKYTEYKEMDGKLVQEKQGVTSPIDEQKT